MKTTKVNQQDSWSFQSIITFMVYIPCLICVAVLINYDKDFDYDPGMIFDNHDFNLMFCVVVAIDEAATRFLIVTIFLKPTPGIAAAEHDRQRAHTCVHNPNA